MEKKKYFIIGLLILTSICMFTFLIRKQLIQFITGSEIRNEDMSPRAKKYLEQTSEKPASLPTTYDQTVNVGNCFSLFIPFTVTLVREDGICDMYIGTVNPKTNITTYMRNTSVPLDEDAGVKLRRMRKDQYEEYTIHVKGMKITAFKKLGGAYERQLFYQSGDTLLVLIFKSFSMKNLESELESIVSSIDIHEKL